MRKITLFLALIAFSAFAFAQNNYTIQFQDETLEVPENIQGFSWNQLPESSRFANGYIGWIQFYETPVQSVQDQFKNRDIQLIEYIPHRTYLAYFPGSTSVDFLRNSGVRAVVPVEGRFKMGQDLKNGTIGDWAQQGDKLLVTLEFLDFADVNYVISDLANQQIAVYQQYKGANIIDLVIPENCLETLSSQPYVKWLEQIVAPDVLDDYRGRGLHRANGLDSQGGSAWDYTGVGVGVLVRDDGIVGPHIDFQGRIDNSLANNQGPSHGDGVAGIMAGAGNLVPSNRGMAAGSDVYVVNYVANFLDSETQTLINSNAVQITNSSYSNGCNAGYTSIAATVDDQTNNIPTLLHVFSAGNSNNNNCGYGAGSQWGNITGGHKQGKNVIATANVFWNGNLVGSSSRGPAADGRIKPDIAANGQNQISTNENNTYQSFGGTSGAAPGIAGISAQLYEMYEELHGSHPPSALIKAALLNTANDYGNVGPDFKFGYGIVNAHRAGMLINEERHMEDEISQGETNNHSIVVPSGTKQVRFMLYWPDKAGAPGANPALVNDLDLVVTDPSNDDYLPFILDHTPDPTLLDLPATNGADHLNNMEQVLINNPAAGTYDLEISGFNVPSGPQVYYIVYEIIQENLTLTYPNGGEHFVQGDFEAIHWDGINTTEDFTLEYSTDNGNNWTNITTVTSTGTNFLWTVPAELTGEAKLRITSGSFQDESDAVFSMAPQVTGMNITQVCPGSASFEWDAVPGANAYDVYILGEKYMDLAGTVNGTSGTVPVANFEDPIWYAIVAKNTTDGWESRRTNALQYPGGLLNCSLTADIGIDSINNEALDFSLACGGDGIVSMTIHNYGANSQSNFDLMYEVNGQTPVVETFTGTLASGEIAVYDFDTPLTLTENGYYTLMTSVDLTGDENPVNDSATYTFNAYVDLVVPTTIEAFELSGVPPTNWIVENPDMDISWEEKQDIVGADGQTTTAAYVNNFDYIGIDEQDALITEYYDLSGISSGNLIFDIAKAQYSAVFSDIFYVMASTDCGETFTIIFGKTGLDLSTLPDYETTPNWEPTAEDHWRQESIDLSNYVGENVIFKFVNHCKNGNSTYIDNIYIDSLLGSDEFNFDALVMSPNPATNTVTVSFGSIDTADMNIELYNSLGQKLRSYTKAIDGNNKAQLDVSNLAQGLYFVSITNGTNAITKKLLVK